MSTISEFFKTAKTGRASQLLKFIEEGFTPDVRNEQGDTALMAASYYGNPETVKTLLDYQAQINTQNNTGQTALMYACNKKNTEIVKLLMDNGANPAIKDQAGRNSFGWLPDDNSLSTQEIINILRKEDTSEPITLPTDLPEQDQDEMMSTRKNVKFPKKEKPKPIKPTTSTMSPPPTLEPTDKTPSTTQTQDQTAIPEIKTTPKMTNSAPKEVSDKYKTTSPKQPEVKQYQSIEVDSRIEEPKESSSTVKTSVNIDQSDSEKDNGSTTGTDYPAISQNEIQMALIANEQKKRKKIEISKQTNHKPRVSPKKDDLLTEYQSTVSHIKPPDEVKFYAFRMNWLRWLGQPFVLLWKGLVWIGKYLWTLVVRAWRGMIQSFHYRNWLIGTLGISLAVFLAIIGFFISKLLDFSPAFWMSIIIAIIPITWALAEITSNIKINIRLHDGKTIREKRKHYRNGTRNMVIFLEFLIFVILCLFILVGIHYLKKIPSVGELAHSSFYIPALFVGAIGFLNLLILLFSLQILPGYMIENKQGDNKSGIAQFFSIMGSLIHHIAKKFPRLILIHIPSALMSVLTLFPILFIVGGSVALFGLTGFAVENFNLQTFLQSYDFEFLAYLNDWKDYVNFFLTGIAVSVGAGIILSFPFAQFAATNYLLYTEKSPIEWRK